MAGDSLEGGCACRHLRYRMSGPPMVVHCCHCRWCQRETGAAFALNAVIEADRVALLSGMPDKVATPSESGAGQTVIRCPVCRVAVWSHYSSLGEKLSFIRVGTLDDPDHLPPDIHIYADSKQPWVVLPPGARSTAGFYNLPDYWSAESLARMAVLRGGG
jgi:hypothetical protein